MLPGVRAGAGVAGERWWQLARLCDGVRVRRPWAGRAPLSLLPVPAAAVHVADHLQMAPQRRAERRRAAPWPRRFSEQSLFRDRGIRDSVLDQATITRLNTLLSQAESQLGREVDVPTAHLLYALATRLGHAPPERVQLLLRLVCEGKISSQLQVTAAIRYLRLHPLGPLCLRGLEQHCGVGAPPVTREEVQKEMQQAIQQKLADGECKLPRKQLIRLVREKLPWADGRLLRDCAEEELACLGGGEGGVAPAPAPRGRLAACTSQFHRPGENYLTDGYVVTPATMDLLKQHLKDTKGKVVTRFPPEPSGILHIGHAMAINLSFGFAKAQGGVCYLRYDDTDPEKTEQRHVTDIREMVEWLGHEPFKVTFASDYFSQLYELARVLITRGHAFVCHQTPEELRGRGTPLSPWRARPVEESLQLFEDMRSGGYQDGEATLRMKLTMADGKQDPVAYRVKHKPHPRTGTAWCIYPTYDFAHCLSDSIENVTHSLCSREFKIRRSSYYWLCNAVGMYCPVQWEFARLNMHHTLVSKRKIAQLIRDGVVRGWDDPRLHTLAALKRRGFPPEAINKFCEEYGVMGSDGAVFPELLEVFVRQHLHSTATRAMAVLNPLPVTLSSLAPSEVREVEVPNLPGSPAHGTHRVPLARTLFIERSDFQESLTAGYHRLGPGQPVGLKHTSYVVELEEVVKDSLGRVAELRVRGQPLSSYGRKPRAFIHWVSQPLACQVRLYDKLFLGNHGDPMTHVNPNSLRVVPDALVDRSLSGTDPSSATPIQFERLGYFSMDPDSTRDKLIFNRTVSLKEASANPVPIL